jgi:methanol metabolism-related c-type cytochrome
MTMTSRHLALLLACGALISGTSSQAQDSAESKSDPNTAVAYEEDGRYYTADDIPTFNVAEDGTVDWLTFSGFRRYHSECHVCHGPDGEGSSYAPALKNSAIDMDYYDFVDVTVNGRQNVSAAEHDVMPSFGTNNNVMCYLDDIYVYLKARGADAIPRGRPAKKEAKSDAIQQAEDACMGG